jgi:hypothetical protein
VKAAVVRVKAAGKDVVTDPTGRHGVEIEDRALAGPPRSKALSPS